MALFGTFGFLVIGAAYVAIPAIQGIRRFDQRLSKFAFWTLFSGMLGMVLSFGLGGTVEIFVYRVMGLDWWGGQVRPAMAFWRGTLALFGLLFAVGIVALLYDLFTLRSRALAEEEPPAGLQPPVLTAWRRPLSAFELGTWLAGLWFPGLLITAGLFSLNLETVRMGDATVPYTLAGIGYPALLLVTVAFAVRFLRAFEARQAALEVLQAGAGEEVTLDVGDRPMPQRREVILGTYTRLAAGRAMVLVNDHDPRHLYGHLKHLRADFTWRYLDQGPEVWRVRIGRLG